MGGKVKENSVIMLESQKRNNFKPENEILMVNEQGEEMRCCNGQGLSLLQIQP